MRVPREGLSGRPNLEGKDVESVSRIGTALALSMGMIGATTKNPVIPCHCCGRDGKRLPRRGKRRYPHLCPHGKPCVAGDRLLGNHANWPRCPSCYALRRAEAP